jgi:serine/threonine protein kinase/WD40 repeat protein
MTATSESDRDPVEKLAEEFLERRRRGETPAVSEYTERYPELADEIREVFPALVVMEEANPVSKELGSGDESAITNGLPRQLGDFRILREVGRGGMGIVYEAEQVSLGRRVALKVLPQQAHLDPRYLSRFEREAKAAARLHHTNIVPVYGVGTDRGIHYYAMQFIQGLGLDDVLAELKRLRDGKSAGSIGDQPTQSAIFSAQAVARSLLCGTAGAAPPTVDQPAAPAASEQEVTSAKPQAASKVEAQQQPQDGPGRKPQGSSGSITLPGQVSDGTSANRSTYWRSVARVGVQVAEALAYAHGEGVLHRDIKPSNLLLDARGHVWVTDFGLAKAQGSEDLTHSGDIIGTLRYMSPESFEGKTDARSDVYALGLTLYELAALRPAFPESDRNWLIKQVAGEEPPQLSRIEPHVPRDLATILHKAIAKEPSRRYQTAEALHEDLQRFLDDRPIRARPISPLEKSWRWCRRNPAVASLMAAVLVVAALGLAGILWQWQTAVANEERARQNELEAKLSAQRAGENELLAKENEQRAKQKELEAKENEAKAVKQKQEIESLSEKLWLQLYAGNINGARLAWEQGNIGHVVDLLDKCTPKAGQTPRYGFEWHYLNRLCHGNRIQLEGSDRQVTALSSDGNSFAAAVAYPDPLGNLAGHDAMVWDLRNGKCIAEFKIHGSPITGLVLAPDGRLLAAATQAGKLGVWDIAKKKQLFAYEDFGIGTPSFSPDGKSIAYVSKARTHIKVRDTQTDAAVHELAIGQKLDAMAAITFSGTGDRLLFLGIGEPKLFTSRCFLQTWDLQSGAKLILPVDNAVNPLAIAESADGTLIIGCFVDFGSKFDQTVMMLRFWDAENGDFKKKLDLVSRQFLPFVANSTSFTSDGRFLVCADNNELLVWDTQTGKQLNHFKGHAGFVQRVFASDDGKTVFSSSSNELFRWDITKPQGFRDVVLSTHRWLPAAAYATPLSAMGQVVLHGTFQQEVWDALAGRRLFNFNLPDLWGMSYSPNGKYLIGTRSVAAKQGKGQSSIQDFWKNATTKIEDKVGRVEVWNAATGKSHFVQEFPQPGPQLDFSSYSAVSGDGRLIAAMFKDQSIKILDTHKRTERLVTLTDGVTKKQYHPATKLWFQPDGKNLVVRNEYKYHVVDVQTGQEVATSLSTSTELSFLDWSPDGQQLVQPDATGKTIHVRGVRNTKTIAALHGHAHKVVAVAFSPDGKRLASADAGRNIKLWDLETMQEVLSLRHSQDIASLTFTADGHKLLAAGSGGVVRIWDATPLN